MWTGYHMSQKSCQTFIINIYIEWEFLDTEDFDLMYLDCQAQLWIWSGWAILIKGSRKKDPPLAVRPLRGKRGGGKGRTTKEKNFFWNSKN